VIISASRRTDIPAFYSKWFMNRIREGWCWVQNPLNANQVTEVSLKPFDVEAIVFWSKNPAPLLPYLEQLDNLGFRYYFQYTLNDYPRALEPNIPSLKDRISTFKELSRLIGSSRVVWRYDPIIISNFTSFDFHKERFSMLAEALKGDTQRVMVSIVDYYQKTFRRLSQLEKEEGFEFEKDVLSLAGYASFFKNLADISKNNKIEIYTCAEEKDFSLLGIPPGQCIDNKLLSEIFSLNLTYKKDPSQRTQCLCLTSKDIGVNNTCLHGCPYCYSTTSYAAAERRHEEHDSDSPMLWGRVNTKSVIKKNMTNQLKLIP
jgi:DNA repair photolyase